MRNERELRRALHAGLDGVTLSASDEQRLAQNVKENKKVMKKKALPVLVIALVLLLTLTAWAVTNWDGLREYLETVRGMSAAGELARWSDEDKLKLLYAMDSAGLVDAEDTRLIAAKDETLSMAERAAQADIIIAERYGENYFDFYTVEQIEFPEEKRSREEQTEYEKWDEQTNIELSKQNEAITQTRTYLETVNHLTEIGNFPQELIRDVTVDSVYDENEKRWIITASIDKQLYIEKTYATEYESVFDLHNYCFEQDGKKCFRFFLDEYGNYLGMDAVNSPERLSEYTLEEALPLAEKAIEVRLGIKKEVLDTLHMTANYGDSNVYDTANGRFRPCCSYMYRNDEGKGIYLVDIDSVTGEVLTTVNFIESDMMKEKENAWIAEIRQQLRDANLSDTLYDEKDVYIWGWTIEELAAWSTAARPIVQQYLAEHPEYTEYLQAIEAKSKYATNEWNNLIILTQYAYGVPDAQAITQDKAYEIAFSQSLALGANEKYLRDSKSKTMYYDVTDPEHPLWKVYIGVTFSAADKEHPYDPTMPFGYFTMIDAYTGEVVDAYPREVSTPMQKIV